MATPPLPTPATPPSPSARRRAPVILVVALLALAIPAVALASHQFSDVPTSNPFHGNISRLVQSGITAGCGGGRYCPTTEVTREQMAAFLTRGLGNVAAQAGILDAEDTDVFYVTAVAIRSGGASGGTGYIHVSADLSVYSDVDGYCPCGIEFAIEDLATGAFSPIGYYVVTDDAVASGRAASGSLSWVFAAPSNQNRTYGLATAIYPTGTTTGDEAVLYGSMTAQYSPFGTAGGGTLALPSDGPFGTDTLRGRALRDE